MKYFLDYFLLLSSLHGFIFSFVFLIFLNVKKRGTYYMAFLILIMSLNNLQSWFLVNPSFTKFFNFTYIETPWHFMVAPLFYAFLVDFIDVKKSYLPLLHLAIFLFFSFITIRLGFLYFNYYDPKISFYLEMYATVEEVISILISLAIFAYSFYIFKSQIKNKILIKENYLTWIHTFFELGTVAYVFWLFPLILAIILHFKVPMYAYYPLQLFSSILIYWLGYQMFIQLRKLYKKNANLKRNQNTKRYDISYQRNIPTINQLEIKTCSIKKVDFSNSIEGKKINVPQDIVEKILFRLEKFEKNRGYTSKNISLSSLSKKLNTNTCYLSKVINHHKNSSFSTYINSLRINDVLQQLQNNIYVRKFTIKAIATEVGYTNSDSFSKVFFKITGYKPSDYIKNLNKHTD